MPRRNFNFLIGCLIAVVLSAAILLIAMLRPHASTQKIQSGTIETSAPSDVFALAEVKAYLSSGASKKRGRSFVDAVFAMQRVNGRPNPITRDAVLRVCGEPDEDLKDAVPRVFYYHYDFRQQDEILEVEFDGQERVASFSFNVDVWPPVPQK